MDELMSINKVASIMDISSRSLRHWESVGLFKSSRDPVSGWRLYNEYAIQSIHITALLRKLDIPIIDIKAILNDKSAQKTSLVLKKQLDKLEKMGSDLDLRKEVILELIIVLRGEENFSLDLFDKVILPMTLLPRKANITKIKEGLNMDSINMYNEVQFVDLPPMRTAAYSCVGIEPEDEASAPVLTWMKKNKLLGTMRLFGFNVEPYPTEEDSAYGFGYCATIPEGVEIPEPLYEWRLPGGTYAVISQYSGDPSHGWKKVQELCSDEKWGWEYDNERHPGLEEHISRGDQSGYLIPILFPVRKKSE